MRFDGAWALENGDFVIAQDKFSKHRFFGKFISLGLAKNEYDELMLSYLLLEHQDQSHHVYLLELFDFFYDESKGQG